MTKKHRGVRKFNKVVYNRIVKLFAGRFIYALVRHTGRKSGKDYSTPVVAQLNDGYIYIPLPYGTDTDWYLNIKSKGNCTVQINGSSYKTSQPAVLDAPNALPAFSPFFQGAFKRAKIEEYLRLKVN